MLKQFRDFLKEYKIVGLAIAFVMGAASTDLVNSLVKDIIMPLIGPLLSGDGWQEAIWQIGPFSIAWGAFLGQLINFIIIAFVIFLIAKKLFKMDKIDTKKITIKR
ncbi:MAG: large conductance mechanosensitive channel protein MscL [Candidatus Komeilibacteria bacterium]